MSDSPPTSRLKIALVCDWFHPRLGGIEMHLYDLASQLMAAGHDVDVVTATPGPTEIDGVRVHRLQTPLFPGYGFAFTPGAFAELETVLRRGRFDLVHAHISIVSPTGWGGAFTGRKLGLPTVVTFHSRLQVYGYGLALMNRIWKWSDWPVLLSAVSPVVAADVETISGPGTVTVLPNGILPDDWRTEPQPASNGDVRIVSVMRLNWKKDPGPLMKYLAEARRRLPEPGAMNVTLIGDGPLRSRVKHWIGRRRLADVVTMTGRLTRGQVRSELERNDIFILPSPWESFGIAALEARCAGLPVIAHSASGVTGFIRHGREGLLAASGREMVDCLVRLSTDIELRSAMAAHNRRTPAPFNWTEVAALHISAYQRASELV